jgi:hypothetical protein
VRRLGQPQVLVTAAIAALVSALLCAPRLLLWQTRALPVWYLEAVLFFGGIVLWAFVFAWHAEYTNRPVVTLKIDPTLFALTTLAGMIAVIGLHLFLDPSLRITTPEDYPASLQQWIAMTLFNLAFSELFLVFAPFAWLVRLFRNQSVAAVLTVFFGVVVLLLRNRSAPVPGPLFAALLLFRITGGFLSVFFYLRGGVLLAWWWCFLIEARHLISLQQ